ncbi:hypothetical protein IWX65_002891 [Arthrobacter sp. CAN_A214]|uniref:hypothetical protein n=1 Tax=Arthrobacter sp. CAN_A214 TaxID=2787720 RepID=UPI0018CA58E7
MALTDVTADFHFTFDDGATAEAMADKIPTAFTSTLTRKTIDGRKIWTVSAHVTRDGSSEQLQAISELLAVYEPLDRSKED